MGLSVTFAPGVMAEDGGNEVKPVVTVNPKVDFNIMQAMDNPSEALQYISPFSEDNGKWTYKADVTFGLPSGYTGEKPVKLVFNCPNKDVVKITTDIATAIVSEDTGNLEITSDGTNIISGHITYTFKKPSDIINFKLLCERLTYTVNGKTKSVVSTEDISLGQMAIYKTAALSGDIKLNGDTEKNTVIKVNNGDKGNLQAFLYVDPVKQQLNAIVDRFILILNKMGKNVTKEEAKTTIFPYISLKSQGGGLSSFTAKITLPKGIVLNCPADKLKDNIHFGSEGNGEQIFVVDNITNESGTLTVTMKLAKEYTNFKELYDSVNGSSDYKLTIPVKVKDAPVNTNLTIKGSILGDFSATANFGQAIPFTFGWQGIQDSDGVDAVLKNAAIYDQLNNIQLTMMVPYIPAPATTTLKIVKKWVGVDKAPATPVEVILLKDGKTTDRIISLDKNFKGEFKYLYNYELDKYSVKESNEKDGLVTIDGKKYKVGYELNKDDNTYTITNTLVKDEVVPPTPQQPKPPAVKPDAKPNKTPQTGDNNIAAVLLVLVLASCSALALVIRNKAEK